MIINKEEYFIKLPNNLVWTWEADEESLISNLNSKTVMVLSNLCFRCNVLDMCYFTLEDVILELGYKCKSGKGKINEQVKDILVTLYNLGFIYESNINMSEIKLTTFVKCKINTNIAKNEYGDDEQFFRLFYKDYQKILEISNVDKDILFNIFCYINSRILHRADVDESQLHGMRTGGKAEATYFTYKQAIKDLSISEQTFKDYIDILKKNKLIFFDNLGLVEKDNKTKMANNVYTIKSDELEIALMDSKYYHEMNGYRIIGKKTDEGTKKIIGLDSRIKQLKEQGYDTAKHENKLSILENDKQYKFDTRSEEKVLEDIKRLMSKLEMNKVKNVVEIFEKEYCKLKNIKRNKKLLMLLERKLKEIC